MINKIEILVENTMVGLYNYLEEEKPLEEFWYCQQNKNSYVEEQTFFC